MNEKEFKDLFFRNMPASIPAETKAHDLNAKVEINGRGVELVTLLLAITLSVYKRQPMPAKEFCEMIKGFLEQETKEDSDKTMSLFHKIFDDLGDK